MCLCIFSVTPVFGKKLALNWRNERRNTYANLSFSQGNIYIWSYIYILFLIIWSYIYIVSYHLRENIIYLSLTYRHKVPGFPSHPQQLLDNFLHIFSVGKNLQLRVLGQLLKTILIPAFSVYSHTSSAEILNQCSPKCIWQEKAH